jgi:hypothetical protein
MLVIFSGSSVEKISRETKSGYSSIKAAAKTDLSIY